MPNARSPVEIPAFAVRRLEIGREFAWPIRAKSVTRGRIALRARSRATPAPRLLSDKSRHTCEVNNFTGSVSHGELVAFSQAQPVITTALRKLPDLLLHGTPDFRRVAGACLQNDCCAACVFRAVQEHLVGTHFNKMTRMTVLGCQVRSHNETKYESYQGRVYVSVHVPIRHR